MGQPDSWGKEHQFTDKDDAEIYRVFEGLSGISAGLVAIGMRDDLSYYIKLSQCRRLIKEAGKESLLNDFNKIFESK